MLKQRIVTAIALIAPLVAALFLLPTAAVAVVFGGFIAVAAWEWGALCGVAPRPRVAYVALVLALGAVAIAAGMHRLGVIHLILALGCIWWLWAVAELYGLARGLFWSKNGKLLIGVLTMVPAWAALGFLHATDPRRPLVLLFVVVLVALADTAAYAAGHALGHTRLAPSISPGKTVEGVIGGVLAVMLLSYFCGTMVWHFTGRRLGTWVGLATLAGLASVVGDLSESKLKRLAGVKDSGTVLPGHGGVLDRIDALTAAAPVFALGWLVLFDGHA